MTNIKYEQDGADEAGNPMFCATLPNFINLQKSPAGFGVTKEQAAFDLGVNFGRENPDHRPISSAPLNKEVLVFGGTYTRDCSDYDEGIHHNGPSVASAKVSFGDVEWVGENCGGHDLFYRYKPTHWLPMPKALPVSHLSDCAVHNMPAMPNGECDCKPTP